MASKKQPEKLTESIRQLEVALNFYESKTADKDVAFLAVSKAFEVAVEYGWKDLKHRVEAEGAEVISPKDAIRQAAQMRLIHDANLWLDFINVRNSSVHDYFGLSDKAYVDMAKVFLDEVQKKRR